MCSDSYKVVYTDTIIAIVNVNPTPNVKFINGLLIILIKLVRIIVFFKINPAFMSSYILGLSCFYHDSAAALIKNGEIVAAAQEERFSRKKHDSNFPNNAIIFCLKSQNINLKDVKEVIYYEKPLLTFERLLETYLGVAPRGGRSFVAAMQTWVKEKLFLKNELTNNLKKVQASLSSDSS